MSEQVTIKEVWDKVGKSPRDYDFPGDDNRRIYMREWIFTSTDGRTVKFSQKPETDPPTAGLTLEFDQLIAPDEGFKTWRGRKPKRVQGGSPNGSQAAQQTSSQDSGWDPYHPKQRLIVRQNALNRAVDVLLARGSTTGVVKSVTDEMEFFEELIWQAASQTHEQKVLEWSGAPARREGFSEVHPPASGIAETSRPAGAPTGEDDMSVVPATSPDARPTDGGVAIAASPSGKAHPATLAKVLKTKRQQNAPDLAFSTFLTSLGVENVNDLSEDEAQLVLSWLTDGEAQAA